MDNVWLSSVTTGVTGTIGLVFASVIAVMVLVIGGTVGYRLYKRFMS